jgi:pimeloyl-ACP methyl ester carboxylesterase
MQENAPRSPVDLPVRQQVLGDVTLEVHELGEGTPLLYLHGEDGLLWSRPLIEDLSGSFHVIAPHHPAWGGSTRPEHVATVGDIARVYAELLEHVDGPVLVVGASIGGWIAAELALISRRPLRGLVLAAPTGIKLGDRETRDFADIYAAGFDDLPRILYGERELAPDLTDRDPADYVYLAQAQEATARYGWAPYMHNPKLRHWLRRIDAPALVVGGSADRFVLTPDYVDGYASLIGADGAATAHLEGAGHRVEEEEPAELARLIRDFADGIVTTHAASLASTGGQ